MLHVAIWYFTHRSEMYSHFISKGGNVNARNFTGHAPLHVINIQYDKHWAAKILLENGAHVNIRSDFNHTPLFIADANGKFLFSPFSLLYTRTKNESLSY